MVEKMETSVQGFVFQDIGWQLKNGEDMGDDYVIADNIGATIGLQSQFPTNNPYLMFILKS